jgi:predicted dinucleotide-binding enzyme
MSKPRIGVIGSGQVAQVLAKGFQKHGYPVHLGTRDPGKLAESVGNALMVDPSFPGGKPTMFIAGNDPAAKASVASILKDFGWEVEDMGLAASARPIEALCQLGCAPGLLRNQWNHAFALLKA